MTTIPGSKVKIPLGKLIAFVTKIVTMAKDGFTPSEGHEILMDFLSLFSVVLDSNLP